MDDAAYFRALAVRCRKSVRGCFDPFAQEEFRRLASEFETMANGQGRDCPVGLDTPQAVRWRQPGRDRP
jgi:hypothetical protein